MIISFEGADTSGKSTQVEMLKERLEGEGLRVVSLHFPNYDGVIGTLIKEVLSGEKKISPLALQHLHIADQVNAIPTIARYYNEGYIVLLDRYDVSTRVYAAVTTDAEISDIINAQRSLITPDWTFIIEVSEEELSKRLAEKGADDIMENNSLAQQVNATYKNVLCHSDRSVLYINGNESIDIVHEEIMNSYPLQTILENFN